jgi:hypothetical protein
MPPHTSSSQSDDPAVRVMGNVTTRPCWGFFAFLGFSSSTTGHDSSSAHSAASTMMSRTALWPRAQVPGRAGRRARGGRRPSRSRAPTAGRGAARTGSITAARCPGGSCRPGAMASSLTAGVSSFVLNPRHTEVDDLDGPEGLDDGLVRSFAGGRERGGHGPGHRGYLDRDIPRIEQVSASTAPSWPPWPSPGPPAPRRSLRRSPGGRRPRPGAWRGGRRAGRRFPPRARGGRAARQAA